MDCKSRFAGPIHRAWMAIWRLRWGPGEPATYRELDENEALAAPKEYFGIILDPKTFRPRESRSRQG